MTAGFDTWHGIKRSDIYWRPSIDPGKCTGCGMCVVTCSEKRNVFGYDIKNRKAVVLYPDNCMVGCNNCQVGCLWEAITFPRIDEVKRRLNEVIGSSTFRREFEAKTGFKI